MIRPAQAPPALVLLLEELLDATLDTLLTVREGDEPDVDWQHHAEYLRALRRQGEAVLARVA